MRPHPRNVLFIAATTGFILIATTQWVRTLSQVSFVIPSSLPTAPPDPLLEPHQRAAALLPATGRISYLTDRDFATDPGSLARFYRAQSHLAPRVLDQHDDNHWALADYEDAAALDRLLAQSNWTLIEPVGEGMAVLRRAEVPR